MIPPRWDVQGSRALGLDRFHHHVSATEAREEQGVRRASAGVCHLRIGYISIIIVFIGLDDPVR